MRNHLERSCTAHSLAAELRRCIIALHADILVYLETKTEIFDADNITQETFGSSDGSHTDPVGKAYMQCELICQYSLLALILRAAPASAGFSSSVSDECLAVAREALHVHEACVATIRNCKREPLMLARYVNWYVVSRETLSSILLIGMADGYRAIVHCPFPPFSILLTYAIQSSDESELRKLEHFAASLEPPGSSVGFDLARPSHLYKVLCKAARLYINLDTAPTTRDTLGFDTDSFGGPSLLETEWASSILGPPQQESEWLSEWWNDNQLFMGVLDQRTFS